MENRDIFHQACWIQIHIIRETRFGAGYESEHSNHLKEQGSKLWLSHSIEEMEALIRFISDLYRFENIPERDEQVNEMIEQYRPKT
jgi:hypothetical protein